MFRVFIFSLQTLFCFSIIDLNISDSDYSSSTSNESESSYEDPKQLNLSKQSNSSLSTDDMVESNCHQVVVFKKDIEGKPFI